MNFKKFLFYLILLIFSLQIINAVCYINYNIPNAEVASSAVYSTSNYYNYVGEYYSPTKNSLSFTYQMDDSLNYKIIYFYALNKRLVPVHSNAACGGTTGEHPSSPFNLLDSYFTGYTSHDLQSSSCVVSNSGAINVQDVVYGQNTNVNFNLKSNLNYFTKITDTTPRYAPEDLLRDYYYMKSNVKVELINADTNQVIQELANQEVLLKEYDKNYPLNLPISGLDVGNYKLRVTTDTSVEPKCDNGRGGTNVVESNVFSVLDPEPTITMDLSKNLINYLTQSSTVSWNTINANSCNLEISSNLNQEVQSNVEVTAGYRTAFLINGETYKTYTLTCENSLGNSVSDSVTIGLDSDLDGIGNYNDNCPNVANPSQLDLNSQTEAGAHCEDTDLDGILDYRDGDNGACYNQKAPLKNGKFDYTYKGCERIKVNSCDLIFDTVSGTIGQNDVRSSTVEIYVNNQLVSSGSSYYNIFGDLVDGRNIVQYYGKSGGAFPSNRDGTCDITQNPKITYTSSSETDTRNKIETNDDYGLIKLIESDGTEVDITVPEVTEEEKKIYIYKDGNLDRTEKVNPIEVAKAAAKIKKLKNKQEAEDFINDTVRLMTKFDIVKNLTYNSNTDKTSVKVKLQDIPQSERQNITIYQVISKDLAESINDINFISDGGGQRIIIDKDPIIGWYFNESDSSEEIEYEVEGESEGGDIIIVQEPILYNEGELIVNYRQTDCNLGEAQILEIDDLEDTTVYNPDTSDRLYKICIAHITEDLEANDDLSNSINLFNYTNSGNLSFLKNAVTPSFISVDRNDIYWDIRISENNPTGNYSCIGSINDENSSLFGDCGYSSKRIWVHLGVDLTPPTTTVDIPYIANTIKLTMNSQDNIGGVGFKELSYCVDSSDSCIPGVNGEEFATTINSQVSLSISCPYDWGCVKYLRFSAKDLDDNTEIVKSEPLKLLDKGSACQADCTAKPSPNRYLKECRNLNGCEYAKSEGEVGDNIGENVALLCDFLIEGSYVKYNSSHDIMCPMGPYRKTKFVDDDINFLNSDCDDIFTNEIPVIFEGQSVIMNIISCIDY